jgi:hypothetical protein
MRRVVPCDSATSRTRQATGRYRPLILVSPRHEFRQYRCFELHPSAVSRTLAGENPLGVSGEPHVHGKHSSPNRTRLARSDSAVATSASGSTESVPERTRHRAAPIVGTATNRPSFLVSSVPDESSHDPTTRHNGAATRSPGTRPPSRSRARQSSSAAARSATAQGHRTRVGGRAGAGATLPTYLCHLDPAGGRSVNAGASARSEAWIAANLPRDSGLLTDESVRQDLIKLGYPRERIRSYSGGLKVAAPGAPDAGPYEFVVSTPILRTVSKFAEARLNRALGSSVAVAIFGTGAEQVSVRQVHSTTDGITNDRRAADDRSRLLAGQALLRNPALKVSPSARPWLIPAGWICGPRRCSRCLRNRVPFSCSRFPAILLR